MSSVVIAGAGAAGLMAAYTLSKHGNIVTVLEANNRTGGRIHTIKNDGFLTPVELGAEFIHGKLPLTLKLLKEAGIDLYSIKGKMFRVEKGQWKKQNDLSDGWDKLMQRMNDLKIDMPLAGFLQQNFSDEKYKNLVQSVQGFAEGFDLADISTASTFGLREEWNNEEGKQFRIEGGYQRLIEYLESQCKKYGCTIITNCCVKKISWEKNQVNVITMCSQYFKAEKIILAVPLSVLQRNGKALDYIEFTPAVNEHLQAAKHIGFGTVIKILLQFDESFWQDEKRNIGFVLMNEAVPTWWTQLPDNYSLLTGWLGGLKAFELKGADDETILDLALQSLANAFLKPVDILREKLTAYKIANWLNVPHIAGGYSFSTIESNAAKNILQTPVEQTIFFAGEALYAGVSSGTVEAALVSGEKAALKLMKQ